MQITNPPGVVILAQGGVGISHTGDTAEFAFVTVTLPANAMGANGRLEIDTLWTVTNSANNKTLRVKIGATAFSAVVLTTILSLRNLCGIQNRGLANSQIAYAAASTAGTGSTTAANTTGVIDTSANASVTITGQLANSGETITLDFYCVKLFPKA